MGKSAHYALVQDTPEYLLIRDLGPWDVYLSVTNDADAVYATLASRLKGRPLFYFDSEGDLCEIYLKKTIAFRLVPPELAAQIQARKEPHG